MNSSTQDDDDGDFTQRTQERLKRISRERRVNTDELFEAKLCEMYSSGGSGKVKAGAYLSSSLDAKTKRAKKATKMKSKKVKKGKRVQSYKEAHAALFCMNVNKDTTPKGKGNAKSVSLDTHVSTPNNKTMSSRVNTHTPNAKTTFSKNVPTSCTFATPSNQTISTTCSTSSFSNSQVDSSVDNIAVVTGSPEFTGDICPGCGYSKHLCHELMFRDFCLQSVMDHFEDDNIRFTDELGIYTAFIRAYTFSVKKYMLDKHGFYERRREVEIPSCMVDGSLAEAQALRTVDVLRRSLLGQRVFDVQTYVEQVKNGERSASAPATYDKIVRDNQW